MITGTRYNLTLEIGRQAKLAADIARGQAEISTGKKILAPSDDPVASARISALARTQADEAAWTRNLDAAAALADRSDTAIAALAIGIDRARELLVAAGSDTLSADNRAVIAAELRGIVEDIQALAATRDLNGGALFRPGDALEIPVGPGITIAPVGSRGEVFGDLAARVAAAADAIEIADPVARRAAVETTLDSMADATSDVATVRGDQGVRAARIETLRDGFAQSKLQIDEERGELEGADVAEVIARIQARQLSLQAAQAVFARVNSQTLFDII